MAFRVTGSKVVVIPIQDAPKIGHIIVPDSAKQRTDQGIVKYIGPDCTDYKPGQYVIFSGHSGTMVYIQNPEKPEQLPEALIILEERFIWGEIIDFEDTLVEGLYFKSKHAYSTNDVVDALIEALGFEALDELNRDKAQVKADFKRIIQASYPFFDATYEVAMEFIADAIRSAEWRQFNPVTGKGIDVHTPRPKIEEYTR